MSYRRRFGIVIGLEGRHNLSQFTVIDLFVIGKPELPELRACCMPLGMHMGVD